MLRKIISSRDRSFRADEICIYEHDYDYRHTFPISFSVRESAKLEVEQASNEMDRTPRCSSCRKSSLPSSLFHNWSTLLPIGWSKRCDGTISEDIFCLFTDHISVQIPMACSRSPANFSSSKTTKDMRARTAQRPRIARKELQIRVYVANADTI